MSALITKQPTLRLGFIGGSLASAIGYTHWVSSQLDGRWQLVSGCFSRSQDESTRTGANFNLAKGRSYSDWQIYIEKECSNLDAVVVLTPTPLHDEIVCRLFEAGVAVICEKAMVATLQQSERVRKSQVENKGFLAVTLNYSGYPMVRVLRRFVEDGKLGNVHSVQVEMPCDVFLQPAENGAPQDWRLNDGEIPTLLLDLGVHVHHLTRFVCGKKPVQVNADFCNFSRFDGVVDDAHIWVNFDGGMRASYWLSKIALGSRNGLKIRIFGDNGSAEWVQEAPEYLSIYDQNSVRTIFDRSNCPHQEEIRQRFKAGHPAGFVEAFANLYWDIADALYEYRADGSISSSYVYGWEHADEGLRVLDAASKANERKSWTKLQG